MLEFTYSIIHEKSAIRIIKILEILDNGQKLVHAKFLANNLKCSVRTISNDVSQLKRDIPENWEIVSVKTKGYILMKPITESIFPVIKLYLIESVIYKVMLGIFNNKYYTLEKWSQILFMNKLTLKNHMKKHIKMLRKSKLDIGFREVQLKGEELNIRYYYHAFFYNTQKYTNELLLPIELRKEISSILQHSKVRVDFEKLCTILFVAISRLFHKHYIKDEIKAYQIYDYNQSRCFDEIVNTIEDYYKIKFPENERDALYNFLFLASDITDVQSELAITYLKGSEPNEYKKFLILIDILITKNNVGIDKREKLTIILGAVFYKSLIHNRYNLSTGFFLDTLKPTQNILLQNYKKNKSIVSLWNKTYNNRQFSQDEMHFFSTYATATLNLYINKLDVLLLFRGTEVEKLIIHSTLTSNLGDSVQVHGVSRDNIKYDFIITNYQPLKTEVSTIYFSGELTESDIHAIKKRIFNLSL
ncbi:hypothetical protein COD78_28365 [Bacillus cereus]|uniref:helix-turn-helix domain-containing protein n=1 Tax=Bacillus cereus TaxID=1396 RepID=UPI000BF2808A|nr:helix-turn-helix domain containing protein [Bacillus cereus]PEX06315.1 hypothetical protein CN454_28820 [Bacillus cereus]PGV18309.1 hypothetical protein COD78_28365 [Bacillus cereus]